MIRVLDLFCGAGGCSVGYMRGFAAAGLDVEIVGVDNRPQPNYPYEFVQADAMEFPLDGCDFIHASPPCQLFSRAGHLRDAQGGTASTLDLLTPMRPMIQAAGVPYVIENVPGSPMDGVTLCGSMFALKVRRHRLFESSEMVLRPECRHREQGRPVGVYHVMGDEVPQGGRTARNLAEGQAAMGIDWMTWPELKESIPPAYTEFLASQIAPALTEVAA